MDITGAHQYLTFRLSDEHYALGISKVREVMDCSDITHVPRMPAFLRGVINLRGNVVPVVDLRLCLGLPSGEQTVDTCIVIADIVMDGQESAVGMLTDAVREVIELDPSMIRPPLQLGTKLPTEYIRGMGLYGDDFLIIIDIDRILTSQEYSAMGALATEYAP